MSTSSNHHPDQNISIRPVSGATVEVYYKNRLREIWNPWASKRIFELLREQIAPDPVILKFAVGDHPAFESWRSSFPPSVIESSGCLPDHRSEFLELANREPKSVLKHARFRRGILWALCEELSRPAGLPLEIAAWISTLEEKKIHEILNCADSLSALRILHRWPSSLRGKAPVNMFLRNCLSKKKLRVARHYRGSWNRDVILCLFLPDNVVSDSLLHLASQCGDDESVHSLAQEILSNLGHWPPQSAARRPYRYPTTPALPPD